MTPSSYLYHQVIGQSSQQEQFSRGEDCSKYILIVTSLLKSFIQAINGYNLLVHDEVKGHSDRNSNQVKGHTALSSHYDNMKVLGKWMKYFQRFEKHILKISREEDHAKLKSEMCCLKLLGLN